MSTIFQNKPIVAAEKNITVMEALQMMYSNKIHHLVVLDKGGYFGLFSERNFFEGTAQEKRNILTDSIEKYTSINSEWINANTDLASALMKLSNVELSALPILDEQKKVIGIVTETDVLKVFNHLFRGDDISLLERGELFLAQNPLAQEILKLLNGLGI